MDITLAAENFIKDNYPLKSMKHHLDEDQIKKIKRRVWYCNCSDLAIPELQKYNYEDEAKYDYVKTDIISCQFYEKGYKNYRIYENGLAFLDIHIVCMLFDYLYEHGRYHDYRQKDVDMILDKINEDECPFAKIKNRKDMYKNVGIKSGGTLSKLCFGVQGTILLKNYYCKEYIEHIADEFDDGDVIDTKGYRGLGIHIKIGSWFEPVDRREYYPIWPLRYLKKRGYLYYLNETEQSCFDELYFDNGISFIPYDNLFIWTNRKRMEKESEPSITIKNNEVYYYNEKVKTLDGCNIIPYPFVNVDQPNLLAKLSKQYKFVCHLTTIELLIFDRGEAFIKNTMNGNQFDLFDMY